MKDFLRSKQLKIIAVILAVVLGFMVGAARTGFLSGIPGFFVSYVVQPIQEFSASIGEKVGGYLDRFLIVGKLQSENEQLKEEMARLREQLVDLDRYKNENEQYKEFLEFKEQNPDIEMVPATVIGRDAQDHFYSFTINVGKRHGISVRDAVITKQGVVGLVTSVSENYAKVTTVFDPSISIGVFVSSTRETAVVTGNAALSLKGRSKLLYLSRDTAAKLGDYIITSGTGGQFPKDLIIGTIEEIFLEDNGITMGGVIKPTTDIQSVKAVMVITNFLGKGEPV